MTSYFVVNFVLGRIDFDLIIRRVCFYGMSSKGSIVYFRMGRRAVRRVKEGVKFSHQRRGSATVSVHRHQAGRFVFPKMSVRRGTLHWIIAFRVSGVPGGQDRIFCTRISSPSHLVHLAVRVRVVGSTCYFPSLSFLRVSGTS